MKTQKIMTALLALALCAGGAWAQERPQGRPGKPGDRSVAKQESGEPGRPGAAGGEGERCHRPPGPPVLTPEEREKLRAAHQQAAQDPAVQEARAKLEAARKAFRETMRAKLLEIDPSLEEILEKLKEARKDRPPFGHPGRPGGRGPRGGPEDDVAAGDIE